MENVDGNGINGRIKKLLNSKMNFLFATVLRTVETEVKLHGNNGFFESCGKGQEKGFSLIRKTLLDHGNDIIKIFDILVDKLDVVPKNSIIEYGKPKYRPSVYQHRNFRGKYDSTINKSNNG